MDGFFRDDKVLVVLNGTAADTAAGSGTLLPALLLLELMHVMFAAPAHLWLPTCCPPSLAPSLPLLLQVLVVAATNRATSLDDALLRPGRFDRTVYMGRPSPSNRLKILQASTASPAGQRSLPRASPQKLVAAKPGLAGSLACLPACLPDRAGG
jgi:SpoVK/Ycf46/Vps4 family AAA+-type ATPase